MSAPNWLPIETWSKLFENHIQLRMLPFRSILVDGYYHIFAFDGATAVFHTSIKDGDAETLTEAELAELESFKYWEDLSNTGVNSLVSGYSVPWHAVKAVAVEHNLTPTLGWVRCMGIYTVWVTYKGVTFTCQIRENTDDATDFVTNFLPSIRPAVDCDGKSYVRLYSGDQSWQTMSYTTRGDNLVTQKIGEADKAEWDAAQTEGGRAFGTADENGFQTKVMTMTFLESVRILKGNAFWTGGDLDCTLHTRLYIPEGGIYGVDGQGNPLIAPADIPIYHHINDQSFLSDCPQGVVVMAESSSDPIPPGVVMEMTLRKKSTNTTWAGFLRLDLYRMQTIN